METPFFNRGIKIGEAIIICLTILGTAITIYTRTEIRLNELELRIGLQEGRMNEIDRKIDRIIEGQNDIKILLQDKVDRKDIKIK